MIAVALGCVLLLLCLALTGVFVARLPSSNQVHRRKGRDARRVGHPRKGLGLFVRSRVAFIPSGTWQPTVSGGRMHRGPMALRPRLATGLPF